MAEWLDRGSPALLGAFEDVCERIHREIRAELLSKKPAVRDAGTCMTDDGGPLSDQLAVIDRLRGENEKLRSELAALTSARDLPSLPESSIAASAPNGASPVGQLTSSEGSSGNHSELAVLQLKYVTLNSNFKAAKEALERRKKERDSSRQREAWLMKKLRAAEEQHGIQIFHKGASNLLLSASSVAEDEVAELPPLPILTTIETDDPSGLENGDMQSTQGASDEEEPELPPLRPEHGRAQIHVKQEPSSDTPVIVSERVLKRKRTKPDVSRLEEVQMMKGEPEDVSVLREAERLDHPTQDSLDLDHIAQRMTTPRKRRQADDRRRQASPEQTPSFHTPLPLASCLVRPPVDSGVRMAMAQAASSILTPVSGNERHARYADDADHTPSVRGALNRGIEALAEDGQMNAAEVQSRGSKDKLDESLAVVQGRGRLSRLLSNSTAERDIEPRPTRRAPAVLSSQLDVPERRELPFEQTDRASRRKDPSARAPPPAQGQNQRHLPAQSAATATATTTAAAAATVKATAPAQKMTVPPTTGLRSKPLAELLLDDFKINPAANKGHGFAFSEVVRDKGERASLRGCVDMHCCGKQWRAMALSQRPEPPLTAAQRHEEQKLLEKYLGDCSYRLASMTKEERADLWIEAKTEELANRFGKHRHSYSRMQSPPGFWNADFPDTQQIVSEKQEAEKRERQAIAERHREAMRPGGRWLFRDE